MNIAFEFDSLNASAGTDLVQELNKRGREGWYPTGLPPLQTPFGLKILLQRAVHPAMLSELLEPQSRAEETPRLVVE